MIRLPSPRRARRGSALITVLMLTAMSVVLTTSMLHYTIGEKRGNERNRLAIRAKNMAENISVYAAEQLTTKLYRTRATSAMAFMGGSNQIYLPDSSGTTNVLNGRYSVVSGMEVRAGMLAPTAYTLVTDVTDTNYGLQVSTATVPIIAKATTSHPTLGTQTAHVLQEMEIAMTPMFQFGLFYNMDLELFPGQTMTIAGPVHTNGRLMARGEVGGSAVLTFSDRVTAAQGLYADGQMKVAYRNRSGGNTSGAGGTGAVNYTPVSGSAVNLQSSGGVWRDHKYGTSSETVTTLNNFKTFTTSTYSTNVRTNVHGVTKLELPGIGTYSETDNPATTGVDERSNGRQIIEPPNPKKYISGAWTATTDSADSRESKISRKAGLYIAVNPDDQTRTTILPDGTTQYVLGRSYRAWLNSISSSNVSTCTEVVLPGQQAYGYNAGVDATLGTADDYMYRNYLPNAYTNYTSVGHNQIIRTTLQNFSTGSGYLVNNAAGYASGDTALTIDTGSGTILPGDVVTIAHSTTDLRKYVVHSFSGTTLTLSSGLRAAVSDNAAVYVDPPSEAAALGTGYTLTSAAAVNATTVTLSGGTGPIYAGNTVTIGSYKYLVTGTLANGTLLLGQGLRASAAVSTAVTVDPLSGTRGTGNRYLINNSGGHSAGATVLNVDTGTGTILPGNVIVINGYSYTVTSVPSSGTPASGGSTGSALTISPGLAAAVSDNAAITLAQLAGPGYLNNRGTASGYLLNGARAVGDTSLPVDTGSGTFFPGDVITIGSYQYTVHAYYAGGAGTLQIVSPGLQAAAADNATVTPERLTGPVFPAEADYTPYPSDAFFYDMRRATGNQGYASNVSGGSARGTTNYIPRAIAKIDFDMARFKMMVARSVSAATSITGYYLQAPNSANWSNSIFNASATTTTIGLGVDDPATSGVTYDLVPPTSGGSLIERMRLDPYGMYYAPADPGSSTTLAAVFDDPRTNLVPASALYDGTSPDAWFDGLAVYVHSIDAEVRGTTSGIPNRVDSGVRLWNGRGPVASLSATGKTGFTFCTNDAVYIVGHFNADGTINATTTSTTNPGGFSARYADSSSEKLCAVMGDAVTLLSQPVYSSSSYAQTNGWCDALSAFRPTNASWSTNWRSTAPSSSNNFEGLGSNATAIRPGNLPYSSTPGGGGSTWQTKLPPVDTEYSAALLVGIVPSNHNANGLTDGPPTSDANGQYSGGAHNFPRLLEDWHCDMGSGTNAKLVIRGSMVALFESRVAMEPWNIRTYAAPDRLWGLHQDFRTANHDVPLEPIVLSSTRKRYMEYTAAEYAAKKTEIEALPH